MVSHKHVCLLCGKQWTHKIPTYMKSHFKPFCAEDYYSVKHNNCEMRKRV